MKGRTALIKGIGLDIVELERVEKLMRHTQRFQQRILSEREQDLFNTLSPSRQIEFVAGRFAAKEAFSKALGTGIGKDCSFQQIEILKNDAGAPVLWFNKKELSSLVTITHTRTVAAAQVVLLKGDIQA